MDVRFIVEVAAVNSIVEIDNSLALTGVAVAVEVEEVPGDGVSFLEVSVYTVPCPVC